jgi:hypothetical protein
MVATYTNTKGAADYLACSVSFLEKCRVNGEGPRFHKLGKAVRYKIEELDVFASAREHGSTAEYAHNGGSSAPPLKVRSGAIANEGSSRSADRS